MPTPIPNGSLELVHGLGVLALVSMGYGHVLRGTTSTWARGLAVGLLFGLGIVLAMAAPFQLRPGVFIDVRGVLLVLAAPFGGWIAAIVAAVLGVAFRLWTGGAGAHVGTLTILLASGIGIAFAQAVWSCPALTDGFGLRLVC